MNLHSSHLQLVRQDGSKISVTMVDAAALFNRQLMDVFLEQYTDTDGTPLDYNDIVDMRIQFWLPPRVGILPTHIESFRIRKTDLALFPVFPETIKTITIINSRIKHVPDLTHLTNLTRLELLDNGFIDSKRMKATIQTKLPPNAEVVFGRDDAEVIGRRPARAERVAALVEQVIERPVLHRHILDTTQTVHLPSVNKGVADAIAIIETLAAQYAYISNPTATLLPPRNSPPEYPTLGITVAPIRWVYDAIMFVPYRIVCATYNTKGGRLNDAIQGWCKDTSKHSLSHKTFMELFELVVRIAANHAQKDDFFERIKQELTDAIGMCFTGRINRLINSTIGFVDGVVVGVSETEQINMEMQALIKRLTDGEITKEACTIEMTTILGASTLVPDIQQAYLDALEDYTVVEIP